MNGYQAHAGVKFTATMMMAALFGMALTNLFVRSSMGVLAPELASDLNLSPFILGAIASESGKGKTGMLHTPQLLRYTKTPIVDAHYSITLQVRSIMIIMQVNPVCG